MKTLPFLAATHCSSGAPSSYKCTRGGVCQVHPALDTCICARSTPSWVQMPATIVLRLCALWRGRLRECTMQCWAGHHVCALSSVCLSSPDVCADAVPGDMSTSQRMCTCGCVHAHRPGDCETGGGHNNSMNTFGCVRAHRRGESETGGGHSRSKCTLCACTPTRRFRDRWWTNKSTHRAGDAGTVDGRKSQTPTSSSWRVPRRPRSSMLVGVHPPCEGTKKSNLRRPPMPLLANIELRVGAAIVYPGCAPGV